MPARRTLLSSAIAMERGPGGEDPGSVPGESLAASHPASSALRRGVGEETTERAVREYIAWHGARSG